MEESRIRDLDPAQKDDALSPAQLYFQILPKFRRRPFQGIPALALTAKRRWAAFYAGGGDEGCNNFVLLKVSEDGQEWFEALAVDHPGSTRVYDPCLWTDPLGRLWLFWAQSYGWYDGRCGVFYTRCDKPDSPFVGWTPPRRIADGILLNKPLVASDGRWLLPIAEWSCEQSPYNTQARPYSGVYASSDQGESFTYLGGADVPNRRFDEHMLIEQPDRLWMLVRRYDGIGQACSTDGGATWQAQPGPYRPGPDSRFFIRRLSSGDLVLVYHDDPAARRRLTAWISRDEGASWQGGLLIDGREGVSYPDGQQDADGRLHLIHDFDRYGQRQICYSCVTPEEILAGRLTQPDSFLARVIDPETP